MIDSAGVFLATLSSSFLLWLGLSPRFAEPIYHRALFEPEKYPHGKGDWNMGWLQGRPFEDVYFNAADGTALNGWFLSQEGARLNILVHHGNAGNIADLNGLIELLSRTGANVFVYDYRGFGRSAAAPSVAGICRDGMAAYTWLHERSSHPIVFYGESLGCAVACQVALATKPAGLILQRHFSTSSELLLKQTPYSRSGRSFYFLVLISTMLKLC